MIEHDINVIEIVAHAMIAIGYLLLTISGLR
jgi:hypothetical protein